MYQTLEEKRASQKSLTRKSSGEFNKTKPDYAIKLVKAQDKSQQSSARYLSELTPGVGRNSTSLGNSTGLADRKKSEKIDAANVKLKANLKNIFGSGGLVQYQKKQFRLGRSLEGLGTSNHSHTFTNKQKDSSLVRGGSAHLQEGPTKVASKAPALTRSTQLPPTKKPRPPLAPTATGSNFMPTGAGGFKVQVSVEILPGTVGGPQQHGHSGMTLQQPAQYQNQGSGHPPRQVQQTQLPQIPQLPRAPISRGNVSQPLPDARTLRASSKSTDNNMSSILAQAMQPSLAQVANPVERRSARQIRINREERTSVQTEQQLKTPCGGLLVQHEEFEASQRETYIRQQQQYVQISEKTEDLEAISLQFRSQVDQHKKTVIETTQMSSSLAAGQKLHGRIAGDSNPTPEVSRMEDSAACLSSNAKHQINWLLSDQVTKTLFEKIYRQTTAQAAGKSRIQEVGRLLK